MYMYIFEDLTNHYHPLITMNYQQKLVYMYTVF